MKMVVVVIAIWLSTALAICTALYFTHDMRCLWFLLIPALMGFKSEEDKADKE